MTHETSARPHCLRMQPDRLRAIPRAWRRVLLMRHRGSVWRASGMAHHAGRARPARWAHGIMRHRSYRRGNAPARGLKRFPVSRPQWRRSGTRGSPSHSGSFRTSTRANSQSAPANRENLAAVWPQSIQARNHTGAPQNAPYAQTSCKKSPHPNGRGPGYGRAENGDATNATCTGDTASWRRAPGVPMPTRGHFHSAKPRAARLKKTRRQKARHDNTHCARRARTF